MDVRDIFLLNGLIRKDSKTTQKAMWQHIDKTREALYNASSTEKDPYDKFLFQDDPVQLMEDA